MSNSQSILVIDIDGGYVVYSSLGFTIHANSKGEVLATDAGIDSNEYKEMYDALRKYIDNTQK